MLSGELYDPSDEELCALRETAHRLSKEYNDTLEEEEDKRDKILNELLGKMGENAYLQGPIQFDYGVFTEIGDRTYANFNFTVLDCAPVTIGKDVFIGTNVSILTAMHALRWQERDQFPKEDGTWADHEYALPITIGDHCWIAGSVTICGGVTIGEGCVIGAGSVVTKDSPPNTLAAGVPCRPIREITEEDSLKMEYK